MRLEKYMELAYFLIRDDSVKIPKDTFNLWTKLDSNMKINLRKPLPIHVRYFTCDVDTDGVVSVYPDIYLRDERMEKVLYGIPAGKKDAPKKPTTPASAPGKKKKAMIRREENVLMG
jgi:murein L,D-transpeptidase YcbB/YkuD